MIHTDIILKSLTLDQLPEQYQAAAELLGLEAYISLCREYGGTALYIPTVGNLVANNVKQRILKERRVLSLKELSSKYGVSESTIRRIQKENEDR